MVGDSDNNVIDTIKEKIQLILDRKFKNDSFIKKKIDVYHDRFNFSCPCCCDSVSNVRKKRGNLYLNSLSYHCYNCGSHYGINAFLSRFGEKLSDDDKIVVHGIQQNSIKFEKKTSNKNSSLIMNIINDIAVPKSIFFKAKNLTTPYKNDFCSSYLKDRCIDIKMWKYFAYNIKNKELYILNVNDNDRIIGYQVRQLDGNSKKSRYLTTNISRMYNDIFGKDLCNIVFNILKKYEHGDKFIEEEDGVENIIARLDRISGLFNICNINYNIPITIVEGPIDSLSIENSIALQGATKMNNYFDNLNNVRYLFDNDSVGKEHTIKKLKEHKSVFLWDKYMKKNCVSVKIKDLNDLQKINKIDNELISECFSDDEMDIIYV